MVKRDEELNTSPGRERDTDRESVELGRDGESDRTLDIPEAYYRPEMGTVIVTNYPRDDS